MKGKRIACICSMVLAFAFSCLGTACEFESFNNLFSPNEPPASLNEENPDINNPSGYPTIDFVVGYDYGFHVEGVVTPLLEGNSLCFNPEDYNLSPILAGDVITIAYTGGEVRIQETYPGTLVFQGGEIVNVWKKSANQVCVKKTDAGVSVGGVEMTKTPPAYVVLPDGKFTETSLIPTGTELYATYKNPHEEGVDIDFSLEDVAISALYSYAPDYPISFSSLFDWAENPTFSADKVALEEAPIGVAPGHIINLYQSQDEEDIQNVLDYLSSVTFKEVSNEEAEMDGGGYRTLTITAGEEEYILDENNGYFKVNGKYYRPSKNLPSIKNGDTMYRFNTITDENLLWVNGEKTKTYDNLIGDIVFKETESSWDLYNPAVKLVLEADLWVGGLYLLDETHFHVEAPSMSMCVYEVVGEQDFTEIFQEFGI